MTKIRWLHVIRWWLHINRWHARWFYIIIRVWCWLWIRRRWHGFNLRTIWLNWRTRWRRSRMNWIFLFFAFTFSTAVHFVWKTSLNGNESQNRKYDERIKMGSLHLFVFLLKNFYIYWPKIPLFIFKSAQKRSTFLQKQNINKNHMFACKFSKKQKWNFSKQYFIW